MLCNGSGLLERKERKIYVLGSVLGLSEQKERRDIQVIKVVS